MMGRPIVYFLYFGSVAVVILLQPVTEYLVWWLATVWRFYGAYIQFWIENGGAVLIVDVTLCSVVGAFYIAIAFAHSKGRTQNQYSYQLAEEVSDCITGLSNGWFMHGCDLADIYTWT